MGKSYFSGGGKKRDSIGAYRGISSSPTLVTSPTIACPRICDHPEELRPLSIEEYAAIQTFPPDYTLAGKLVDQYRQLGNAVPCAFGEAVAEHLLAFDEGRLEDSLSDEISFSRYSATNHATWSTTAELALQ